MLVVIAAERTPPAPANITALSSEVKVALERVIVPDAEKSVTSLIAPALISIPLIVSSVTPVITPERLRVVTPLTAPPVVTSNAFESIEKLSPLSPRVTTPKAVSV